MNDEKKMQKALNKERESRRQVAEQARQAVQEAQGALSKLRVRDGQLEARYQAFMTDPAGYWRELRDIRDQREYLNVAIQRAQQARSNAQAAIARADQRSQDGQAIRQAAGLAVKVGR